MSNVRILSRRNTDWLETSEDGRQVWIELGTTVKDMDGFLTFCKRTTTGFLTESTSVLGLVKFTLNIRLSHKFLSFFGVEL